MHLQFDVLRISSRLYLIYVLFIFSINSVEVQKSKYILPALPETPYTLNDVIILPQNTDVVQTTIIISPTSTVLATVNLTRENGFRFGYDVALQNVSVKSGLQIITTSKTTLVIELATSLLKLPSTDDYGHIHHIFALKDNLGETQDKYLFIQSTVLNSSIKLCAPYSEDEMIRNFARYSRNCTTMRVPVFDGLLLNNTTMWPDIEIISEHPISILEGHINHLSSLVENERSLNTSNVPLPQISWTIIPPFSNRSNQFVLFPSQDRREVKLGIVSPVNTSLEFYTNDDIIGLNLTEKKPYNISMSIVPGGTLVVTGKDNFSLRCSKANCNNDIFPFNIANMNSSSGSNNEEKADEYQWIYISNDTAVLILCPLNTDISVYSLEGSVETAEEIKVNTTNLFLKMKYFIHSSNGLYRISINATIEKCRIFYLPKYRLRDFDNDKKCDGSVPTKMKFASLFSKIFRKSTNDSSILTRNITSNDYASTYLSSNEEATKSNNMFTEIISLNRNTDGDGIGKDKVQNTSASFLPDEEITKTTGSETSTLNIEKETMSSIQHKLTTQSDMKVPGKIDNDNQNVNDVIDKSNSSKRFKAVVDIIQSKDGSKNTFISKSDKHNNPSYTYTFDINENDDIGDGKNPVAIIASLVSAILAVGAIILLFLLKDFCSRRQKIRKTRIRPFISYY